MASPSLQKEAQMAHQGGQMNTPAAPSMRIQCVRSGRLMHLSLSKNSGMKNNFDVDHNKQQSYNRIKSKSRKQQRNNNNNNNRNRTADEANNSTITTESTSTTMSGNNTTMNMNLNMDTLTGRRLLLETSPLEAAATDATTATGGLTMVAKPLHQHSINNNKNNSSHRNNKTMRKEHETSLEQESSTSSSSGQYESHHNVITADGISTNSATNSANTSSATSSSEDNNRRYRSDIAMGTSVDEYGLPVPMDGHLEASSSSSSSSQQQEAAVTAEMNFPSFFDPSASASSSEKGDSKLPACTSVQVADEEWNKKRKNHPVGSPSSSLINQPHKKTRRPVIMNNTAVSENGSSGSGTEGGYAGEASSSDKPSSCSSPSLSSGEERMMHRKRNLGSSSSSTIADFDSNDDSSPLYSDESSSDEEMELVPRNLMGTKMEIATRRKVQGRSILQTNYESAMRCAATKRRSRSNAKMAPVATRKCLIGQDLYGKPAIMVLGCDLMAHCMTYLEPPEVHDLLTAPLSKDWRSLYTMPQDLWRVLCLTEPFRAKFDATDGHDSDESSFPTHSGLEVKHLLGKYRLLYTSFVRCMRYLTRIKDDAINGRPPSITGYNGGVDTLSLRANENLKTFLARARGIIVENKKKHQTDSEDEESSLSDGGGMNNAIGVTDENSSIESGLWRADATPGAAKMPKSTSPKKPQFAHSQMTQRLLGPSKTGAAGNVNLPWSCAIYSIVNWMVAFADVEGIQTMCLKVLPFLLEDESQRTTSQRAGLTDIVLRAMVLFPNSIELHTAAFHTIVLLARPLGGREGMLFHCSMVNSSGIFHDGCQSGKNGIAVMLDSMRRFESDEVLQAMSCWSLVNIALAPSQKAVLVKLGGISVVANAMMQHPFNTEVQFRALFALINLVIPYVHLGEGDEATANQDLQEALGEVNNTSEREMLDDSVSQIANLVVVAMKNFCASESILNRACLVLHNLSLTEEYHVTLLWTPNCYQMLEWCLANYRMDQILQQSAAGTLHRLQTTLAGNDDLRQRFTSALQSQQQSSLEQAHREALLLHQQTEQLALQQQRST